jgi:hypothetical protein
MTIYTEPRYTNDLDVWVRPTPENAARVYRALQQFGAPLADLDDLLTDKRACGRPQDLLDVEKLEGALRDRTPRG